MKLLYEQMSLAFSILGSTLLSYSQDLCGENKRPFYRVSVNNYYNRLTSTTVLTQYSRARCYARKNY